MKYMVIDSVNGDEFIKEFDAVEEAIEYADVSWGHLSDYDKKHRDAFYVLESVDPDEDSEHHFDGDYVKIYKSNGENN